MSFLSLTTTLQSSFNHSSLKEKAVGAQRGSVTCQRTHTLQRDTVWVGVHCFPDSSVGKESISLQCRRPWFNSWVGKIRWRRERLLTPVFLGFPCGSAGKESACNAGDPGLIPGLGRSPGEGKGYPVQHSVLENFMDCIAHGVAKSQSDTTE